MTKASNVTGTRLVNSAAAQARYKKAIRQLVRQMERETLAAYRAAMKGEAAQEFYATDAAPAEGGITAVLTRVGERLKGRFLSMFAERAPGIAEGMVSGVSSISAVALKSSALSVLADKTTVKIPPMAGKLGEIYNAAVAENVSLITSIPEQYLKDIEGAAMRSITQPDGGLSSLTDHIQHLNAVTDRRADMIAKDQTRKVYNSVNAARLQDMGVAAFEWIHSGGSSDPRPLHVSYNGKVFRFDNLPVIDERTGERGIPGQAVNCGCTMKPVFIFDDDEE